MGKLTPGATLPVSKYDICVPGYAGHARNVPQSVKEQAYESYGITSREPGEYEVDHLISLELGGSNDTKNLWPQSYHGMWNARIKDGLENRLHELVCMGKLELREAQYEISHNWIQVYCKYMNNTNCNGASE